VRSFNVFGKIFFRFPVIGHTLPFGGPIDGLLGMDVLGRVKAKISVAAAAVEIE